MFFFSNISGTINCYSAQLLIIYRIRKRKKHRWVYGHMYIHVRWLLAKELFNITLSGIGRVFIYAAHLDVELQHIQNVMYHSSMEMPKIVIWEVEKGSPQGIRNTPLLPARRRWQITRCAINLDANTWTPKDGSLNSTSAMCRRNGGKGVSLRTWWAWSVCIVKVSWKNNQRQWLWWIRWQLQWRDVQVCIGGPWLGRYWWG